MDVMTTRDASRQLGISQRQVQRLANAGRLHHAAGNTVSRASVVAERAARAGGGRHVRAWAEPTAWAGISLLAGRDDLARHLGASQLSRLRSRLRTASAEGLATMLRERAAVHRFDAHSSALERLSEELVIPEAQVRTGGLTPRRDGHLDGYLARDDLDRVVARYALNPSIAGGNVTIRATSFASTARSSSVSGVLAGVDLAGSTDPRQREEGLDVLAETLERFRRR